MRIFRTPPYNDQQELLDDPSVATGHDLQHTLRDIRRANIFGLGTWVVKHHLGRMLAGHPKHVPLRVLDLASGSGDIPEALCRWAQREGYSLSFVVTDISEQILDVARKRINKAGFGGLVTYVACDAAGVPFSDKSFDFVLCSLAFHHLDLAEAHTALVEMARLARIGFVVNDVYRSQGAWYMAWFLTRVTTTSWLTRNDGLASVMRAFTPRELHRISKRAGVPVEIHTHPFWRVAVVGTNGRHE